jgi:predicted nucleic acid-binding protein
LTLIVDSYAWVEFLTAGPRGPRVREKFESSGDLVTPDIVLAELARVFARQGMERDQIVGHLRSMGALSTIQSIDIDVALGAISADEELRQRGRIRKIGLPSFADAIILSFARCLGARVLTADKHFEGIPETEWVGA